MRVVHLTTRERSGGAARAAHRLHTGLRQQGVESHMVVHGAESDDPAVHPPGSPPARFLSALCLRLDGLPLRLYRDREPVPFNPAWVPGPAIHRALELEPDVLHLHWLGGGFVRPQALASAGVPLVWTLHDMWAFTGGCHYSRGCRRYRETCGACPRLGSRRERDLSRWGWARKRRALEGTSLTVVAPSRWMARRAAESSLLGDRRTEVIPNGLDLETYRPRGREESRRALGLPGGDRFLAAFGAVGGEEDPRKGGGLVREATARLAASGRGEGIELVVFGGSERSGDGDFELPVHRLGYVTDEERLARIYSAADVFLLPSREDNLPNTAVEALACGTPIIACEVGGVPEIVEDGVHGRLVPPGVPDRVADAIVEMAASEEDLTRLARAARQKAEAEYGMGDQARRCLELYRDVAP